MLPSDITLNTNTYALQTQRANSSVRGDSARPLETPVTLEIAHETAKNGRVSSVIILSSHELVAGASLSCPTAPISDALRVQFKMQYNPTIGRTGIDAEILRLKTDLISFITSADFDRIVNREV